VCSSIEYDTLLVALDAAVGGGRGQRCRFDHAVSLDMAGGGRCLVDDVARSGLVVHGGLMMDGGGWSLNVMDNVLSRLGWSVMHDPTVCQQFAARSVGLYVVGVGVWWTTCVAGGAGVV